MKGRRLAKAVGCAALLAVLMMPAGILRTGSATIPAQDSGGYTALPVWSGTSGIEKMLCGEFDSAHPGLETAVFSGCRVTILEEDNCVWSATSIAGYTGTVTVATAGAIDNSTVEDEILYATADGTVSCLSREGSESGAWTREKAGDNSTWNWGRVTGMAVTALENSTENVVVVTGTGGKVVELSRHPGMPFPMWSGRTLYMSTYPINGVAAGDVSPLNDGNELFIITGGSDNSVLFLSPYTGPTAMYGAGWSAVRIWGSTGNLLAISTGDIDPFNGNDEIVAVDGNKLDTGELYSIVEVWKSGGRWSSCEIFASDTPLYAAIGDFNSSNPGNEVAAAEGNGGVSMLWKPVPGNVWNSTRLWKSPKTLTGAAAADIAGSWTGAELAVAGTASITMLTESTPSVPALSVLSPENYAVVQGSDITIRWAGSNWNGKAFVRLYYSTAGASGPWTVIADNQQPSGSIAWSIPGYTQGATYWLVAVLFDAVGLSASDMVMFYSSHDTQPPQITHDPVTSVYLGDPVVIRAVVVDDTAVASVYIYFRTLGETQYKSGELFSVSASSDETYTITIPPAAVNPPAMEYYITATDTAGNTAKSPPDAPASPYVISVQDKNDTLQLDMVCIHPSDIVVTVGSEVKFEAAALSSGFCRIDAEFSWKFAGSVGTLDGEGRFRATETGKGRVEVTAAYNGVSMTATAAITVINPCFGVRGTVCNTGGKALQSAVVTMKSGDSRWSAGASSDGSGSFAISGIPAGEIYTIHVKKEGYRERTLSGITSGGEVSITLEPVPQAAPGYPVPDEAAPVIFIVIIGGGLLGLAGMMADALKYKLFCVLAPLYSKIEKDKILDNFVRGQVYGHIRTNPGTHYSKIRRVLGIKNGSLAYHLRTLEKSEFVKSRFDGKYKRFYPCGMKIPDGGGMTLSEPQQRIVEVVRKSPGISQSSIGRTLNFRKQSINYHIKQLVGAEVLQVVSIGRETRCYSVCG